MGPIYSFQSPSVTLIDILISLGLR